MNPLISRWFALTLWALLQASVWATKVAAPADQTIPAAGGKFELKLHADTGVHEVKSTGAAGKVLWNFTRTLGHDDYFLSADGAYVVGVAWQFVKVDELDQPAVVVYGAKGIVSQWTFRQVGNPRSYRPQEVGPIGDFWRVWRDAAVADKETIHYALPEQKKLTIDLKAGTISVQMSFRS